MISAQKSLRSWVYFQIFRSCLTWPSINQCWSYYNDSLSMTMINRCFIFCLKLKWHKSTDRDLSIRRVHYVQYKDVTTKAQWFSQIKQISFPKILKSSFQYLSIRDEWRENFFIRSKKYTKCIGEYTSSCCHAIRALCFHVKTYSRKEKLLSKKNEDWK